MFHTWVPWTNLNTLQQNAGFLLFIYSMMNYIVILFWICPIWSTQYFLKISIEMFVIRILSFRWSLFLSLLWPCLNLFLLRWMPLATNVFILTIHCILINIKYQTNISNFLINIRTNESWIALLSFTCVNQQFCLRGLCQELMYYNVFFQLSFIGSSRCHEMVCTWWDLWYFLTLYTDGWCPQHFLLYHVEHILHAVGFTEGNFITQCGDKWLSPIKITFHLWSSRCKSLH